MNCTHSQAPPVCSYNAQKKSLLGFIHALLCLCLRVRRWEVLCFSCHWSTKSSRSKHYITKHTCSRIHRSVQATFTPTPTSPSVSLSATPSLEASDRLLELVLDRAIMKSMCGSVVCLAACTAVTSVTAHAFRCASTMGGHARWGSWSASVASCWTSVLAAQQNT